MSSKKSSMNVRVDEDTKKRLEEISVKEDVTVAQVVRNMIISGLEPETETTNQFKFLDDGCELRDYLAEHEVPIGKKYGEGFYCFLKAPSLIKLGSGIESAASKICSKCIIRDEALADRKTMRKQRDEGIKIEIPSCNNDGQPNEDLTEMYCPLIGKYRPVIEKKDKKDYIPCRLAGNNNSNCRHLKYKIIVTGLKEIDNR